MLSKIIEWSLRRQFLMVVAAAFEQSLSTQAESELSTALGGDGAMPFGGESTPINCMPPRRRQIPMR